MLAFSPAPPCLVLSLATFVNRGTLPLHFGRLLAPISKPSTRLRVLTGDRACDSIEIGHDAESDPNSLIRVLMAMQDRDHGRPTEVAAALRAMQRGYGVRWSRSVRPA